MMSKKKTTETRKNEQASEVAENLEATPTLPEEEPAAGVTEIPVEIKDDEPEAESIPEEKKSEPDLAQKYLEQLQWQQAEFQNYKKRVDREKNEIARYVKGEFIRKLLPVIDDLERSLKNQADKKEFEGFRLISDKLMQILKEEGLEEVAATGNMFDPNYHDALYTQEVEDAESDGKVLEEWEKGFFFQGTLLRASKVKVGKKKS